jgi:hypothetical protein
MLVFLWMSVIARVCAYSCVTARLCVFVCMRERGVGEVVRGDCPSEVFLLQNAQFSATQSRKSYGVTDMRCGSVAFHFLLHVVSTCNACTMEVGCLCNERGGGLRKRFACVDFTFPVGGES